MTTSERASNGGRVLQDPLFTLSAVASPVSRSRSEGFEEGLQTSAGAGRGCTTSFAQLDPDMSWSRTYPDSLPIETPSASSSPTWPRSGSMRNGVCFERPSSVHRIPVNGSTSWPTPRASMGEHGICWARAERGGASLAAGGLPGLAAHQRWRAAGEWLAREPRVARLANGIPDQLERIKALGNAVVPAVAEHVGQLVMSHARAEVPA